MTKNKLMKLIKYQSDLKDKITLGVPHAKRGTPATHKEFLANELRMVTLQIDAAKEIGVK